MTEEKIKALIAKLGLDGHEVGPIKISRERSRLFSVEKL
jgi:methylmalonyl-CoA mutase cobalamin-binding subunit